MGVFSAETEDTSGSRWLLESFQRQSTIGSHIKIEGLAMSTREEYFDDLSRQIKRMLDDDIPVGRPLNNDLTQVIKLPVIQGHLLKSVSQDVTNIYWNLNQHAYFMKQIALNNYLQIESHRFLTNPSTELKHYMRNDSPKPRTNNDASRRSRIKKKISTELLLEIYDCDKAECAQLDEDERQLQVIIALLEDMVYEQTGNARLINYYRDVSCLA